MIALTTDMIVHIIAFVAALIVVGFVAHTVVRAFLFWKDHRDSRDVLTRKTWLANRERAKKNH